MVTTKKISKRNTKNLSRKKIKRTNQKNYQATINTINLTKAVAVAKIDRLQKCPAMVAVLVAATLKSQWISILITSHLK